MDIVLSLLALLLLWPFMLMIALSVKLYDGGPALYKQVRLTKDGETFELLKFRSMRVDAEADGVARLSTGDKDDRITPVGSVLRKVRLDALPQLLCILRARRALRRIRRMLLLPLTSARRAARNTAASDEGRNG